MTKKPKEFKIRYRNGGDCRILNFNLKQLEKYQPEAQLDFIAMLLQQTNDANDQKVRLDWELQGHFNLILKSFNERGKSCNDIIELHTHRALTDYCSRYVNLSVISDFETMMILLENYYEWQDKHRKNLCK